MMIHGGPRPRSHSAPALLASTTATSAQHVVPSHAMVRRESLDGSGWRSASPVMHRASLGSESHELPHASASSSAWGTPHGSPVVRPRGWAADTPRTSEGLQLEDEPAVLPADDPLTRVLGLDIAMGDAHGDDTSRSAAQSLTVRNVAGALTALGLVALVAYVATTSSG